MSYPPKFNRVAHDAMMVAEVEYLRANGWENHEGTDDWSSENLGRVRLRQGHAVNCQKQFDRRAIEGRVSARSLSTV